MTTLATLAFASNAMAVDIDGVLNESQWRNARVLSDFTVTKPFNLAEPQQQTTAKVFTDEKGIYIGITNRQSKLTQLSDRSARDADIESDSNTVVIDFDAKGLDAYGFEVGNGGSIKDGIWRNENDFSSDWDGVWTAKTSSDENAWYSEIFIPWGVAPMLKVEQDTRKMGIYVARRVADSGEVFANAGITAGRQRFISQFPQLELKNFADASLQVFGYSTARQDLINKDSTYDMGVDIFWKPDSSQQLSLTINPDFAQIESDDIVVNFSPSETFFSERRSFFTENQSLFDLRGPRDLRLIHTRRIGSAPDSGASEAADIDFAVKYSATTDSLNYGVFGAFEGDQKDSQGRKYYVARAVYSDEEYNIGWLTSYTDRPELERTAMVNALDFLAYGSDNLKFSGQWINSSIDQHFDGIDNTKSDNAAWLTGAHQISQNWSQNLKLSYFGNEFDVNDLGFLPRANLNSLYYDTVWSDFDFVKTSRFKSHQFNMELDHQTNTASEHIATSVTLRDEWILKDTSYVHVDARYTTQGNDDRISRGNGSVNTKDGLFLSFLYVGDNRGKYRYHARIDLNDEAVDGKGVVVHFHPSYFFSDNYSVSWGSSYAQHDNWLKWDSGTDFSRYVKKQFSTGINFNGIIADNQEIRIKFEWLALSAEGQDVYSLATNGDLDRKSDIQADSFTLADTAIQVRYRYEFSPLSNLYLVYSRGGSEFIDESRSLSDSFTPAWKGKFGDNFMVKVRYQF